MVHSSSKLPPLDTLEAFSAAARTGSFSAAAAALGLTHGAVSRQIGRLERWLGMSLFERAARGVTLTPDGRRFHEKAENALDVLRSEDNRWAPRRDGPVAVRLSATASFVGLWLLPRLAQLEGGDLHVETIIEYRLADFAEGIDLAVRCGRGPWDGVISVPLWREEIFPVAAPELAGRLGPAPTASALAAQPLLHDSTVAAWRQWLAVDGVDYAPKRRDRRFEDYNLVLEACAHGLGIALERPGLVDGYLASGRLMAVSDRRMENTVAFHLVRPETPMRGGAVELATRLLRAAGRGPQEIAAFLSPPRRRGGSA